MTYRNVQFVPIYFSSAGGVNASAGVLLFHVLDWTGLDGISVKLLKDTSDVIAQPLANIFNLSLQTGIFPDDWKIAKISPVFEEGNKTDCGNYRPISVISVVAKLFEGLVYNQLRTFISDNNILVKQ